jgi:RNA polymerase sigma factor (sigma-70 family)
MNPVQEGHRSHSDGQWFATTHWSVVLEAAGSRRGDAETRGCEDAKEALERLCSSYWPPLYAYVRRTGRNVEDSQDLTQEFFVRLLDKGYLGVANPERGRFRTFLLSSLKNFLANDWKREHRQKRGGGATLLSIEASAGEERYAKGPVDAMDPERLYEKRWATTLLDLVLQRLGEEYAQSGRGELFHQLKTFVWGERGDASYEEIASCLGLSEGAVKVAVHRLRQRFRALLRVEIGNTVSGPAEIDKELRHLILVIGG